MGFDQKEIPVICISPGINGTWDVSEKGYEMPLASFDDKEDAYAYATELSRTKQGATVLVEEDEGFSPLHVPDDGKRAGNAGHDSTSAG